MPQLNPLAVHERATALSTRLLKCLEGRSALESIAALSMALTFIADDPTAPPRPGVIDELAALHHRFLREFLTYAERDAAIRRSIDASLKGSR